MPIINCLGCGREIQFADSETGQRIECAGCGAVVTDEATKTTEFDLPAIRAGIAHHRPTTYLSDSEPWYYRFLSIYANVVLWLAIGSAVLTLIAFAAIGVLAWGKSRISVACYTAPTTPHPCAAVTGPIVTCAAP